MIATSDCVSGPMPGVSHLSSSNCRTQTQTSVLSFPAVIMNGILCWRDGTITSLLSLRQRHTHTFFHSFQGMCPLIWITQQHLRLWPHTWAVASSVLFQSLHSRCVFLRRHPGISQSSPEKQNQQDIWKGQTIKFSNFPPCTYTYTCSSRYAEVKLEWQGTLRVPHTALHDRMICGPFLRKLTQTSETDNVNRTDFKSKQTTPSHQ